MRKVVVSDTSCFILLADISALNILKEVYENVLTTVEVADEFGETLPDWVEIRSALNKTKQRLLETQIDKGEASAIALAMEIPGSTIILDDLKARKLAEKNGLNVTGTLGVLVRAKLKGKIESIIPYLEKIRKTNFYLSLEIEQQALSESGE